MANRTRTRKRKAADNPIPEDLAAPDNAPAVVAPAGIAPFEDKNVSPFEGTLSLYAGALLIVAGLFPRTLKQVVLLGLGAAFVYRGQSRHCPTYAALGIDTNRS